MYLLDTNIFLEILRNRTHSVACEQLLTALSAERPGFATAFSLHAIAALMGAPNRSESLQRFLRFFSEHPHLYRYDTTPQEELLIAASLSKWRLDFDDALQYYVAKQQHLTLVTLDRDFRHLKDIAVATPMDIMRA